MLDTFGITVVHMDLNLLVALDALFEEGSVSAAAARLNITQPAMSRTLARLRRATGDDILVRSGRLMLLTPYAEELRAEVHQLVGQASVIFTRTRDVDPATLERTFTLQCNDALAGALLPRLAAHVASVAPSVDLRFLPESGTNADELRRGHIDVRLTAETTHPADVRTTTLLTDHVVTVARRSATADPATRDGFTALPHVVVSRRGRRRNLLDDILSEQGLTRRVALTVPTVTLALAAVAASDMLAVVPNLLTAAGLDPALAAHRLPVETPAIPAVMAWHTRHDRDAVHHWLRTTISETFAEITPTASATQVGSTQPGEVGSADGAR
jgi:DNA-binding transcriptional LysR family regulator